MYLSDIERVCVVGAGAIGGLLGGRISLRTDLKVTLIARGPHLREILKNGGLRLIESDGSETLCTRVTATDKWEKLGTFDIVILAVKSHGLAAIAHLVQKICHENTIIIPVQNGIPWWYFHKNGGTLDGRNLTSIDPEGKLSKYIPLDNIVGCIAFPAAEVVSPGVVKHVEGRAFPLGEPDRSISDRATKVSHIFEQSGFLAPVRSDFREEIWLKILGNLCFNPISALTGAYVGEIVAFEPSRQLCHDAMTEAESLANALGCFLRITVEHRLEKAVKVGNHRTSMLQDRESGKPLEVELLTSVVEIANMIGFKVPTIRALEACTLLTNKTISIRSRL